jgi:hypothetical protein
MDLSRILWIWDMTLDSSTNDRGTITRAFGTIALTNMRKTQGKTQKSSAVFYVPPEDWETRTAANVDLATTINEKNKTKIANAYSTSTVYDAMEATAKDSNKLERVRILLRQEKGNPSQIAGPGSQARLCNGEPEPDDEDEEDEDMGTDAEDNDGNVNSIEVNEYTDSCGGEDQDMESDGGDYTPVAYTEDDELDDGAGPFHLRRAYDSQQAGGPPNLSMSFIEELERGRYM